MAIIKVDIKDGNEFFKLYETHKKWLLLDQPCKLWDTVMLTNSTQPRWKDWPVYRTITSIDHLEGVGTIVSIK